MGIYCCNRRRVAFQIMGSSILSIIKTASVVTSGGLGTMGFNSSLLWCQDC